jgi:hypothetical protein
VLVRATVCETSAGAQLQSLSSDRFSTPQENPTTLSRLFGFETPISFPGFRHGADPDRIGWEWVYVTVVLVATGWERLYWASPNRGPIRPEGCA